MEEKENDFTARAYQVDLYENAVNENSIIYLPTGSGKTFIAVLLIKKLSGDIQKTYSEGGKRTIFIVNTVHLVTQQSDYIKRLTGLQCGSYSGDSLIDFWTETEWLTELEQNQVLVMTAQIFLDMLLHGYTELNRINLIIFDECHRAVSDHPMRKIMQLFQNCPANEQPRVLGLSATLLNCNVKPEKVEPTVKSLETTFHARVATVDTLRSVKDYYATPKEVIVEFDPYVVPSIAKQIFDDISQMKAVLDLVNLNTNFGTNESSKPFQPKTKNAKLTSLLVDIEEHIKNSGLYGGSKCVLLHLIQVEYMKRYTSDMQTAYIMEYLATEFIRFRKLLEDEMMDSSQMERIHKYTSDQIRKLFIVLKEFYNNKLNQTKFCCIIFVQRRFTAQVLYHILKSLSMYDDEYKFLLPDFMTGFSNAPHKNAKEVMCISKWNKEVLQRFKNGLSNCVIATDVIDEGLDIPKCTLVVRYNLPMDIRAYIQSKGRARHMNSQYTFLLPKGDIDYLKRYQNFKTVESYLQKILIGFDKSRKKPMLKDIECELYKHNIEPYVVIRKDGGKSILIEESSISLINTYCAMLYKSKFVHLAPVWILYESPSKKDNSKSYQVSLELPVVSPLRSTIYGDVMSSMVGAKRSSAMKACIELHKIGELSDNLIPITFNDIVINTDNIFPNWVKEDTPNGAAPGTYKKKRHHDIQFPETLKSAFPTANKDLHLHIIDAKPAYLVPHDNRNLVFYNLLSDKAGFGILSTKQMPQVPSFPIFMNVGELNVDIKVNHAIMNLTRTQIDSLKMFHTLLFNQIVTVIKDFMVFDDYNLDNCFLIVPVNKDGKIDWETVEKYKSIEYISASIPFHFKNSDYDLALVVPSYRGSANVYIVTQVCDDLTPDSCFPTEDFFSYAHYYKKRHSLSISNTKQPMLEVKPISKNINCIKIRSMKPGLSKRKRADLLEDFEEHLVPELCFKIRFPALYWLKTTMLPSVLHRVSQLLVAEELRICIHMETGLGILHLPKNEQWPQLVIENTEREEPFEPLLETPLDESVESSQPEPNLMGPEIDVLNTEANQYPWSKDQEPADLCRNIDQIQMIDVEYYCQFMHTSCPDLNIMKNEKIQFMSKVDLPVPPIKIFSIKDSRGPDPVQIMYALTTKMGNDAFDLERLETLGDSYLKFIASLFLYNWFPQYNEGRLTALKGKLIGNRNLYYCGVKRRIPGRMKVDEFVPMSNFIAPAYTAFRPLQKILLDGEVSPNVLYELHIPENERYIGYISSATQNAMEEKVLNWNATESRTGMEHYLGKQIVPDKAVADSVEALIGVYLRSLGLKGAAVLLKWLQLLPDFIDVQELLYTVQIDKVVVHEDIRSHVPYADKIENRLGYKFQNPKFLLQAFTHPSYTCNKATECYQRLEFLGDAVLDFLITCYIYESCGNLSPGALTDLRSALVNNITFACLAVRYGLHTGLLAFAPALNTIIDRFVKFQEERNHVVNDELLWVLLEEEECNMAEYVDVPKVLGDLFESTIGAIYLDCGKDLAKVWEIIYCLMYKEIDEFSKNVPKQVIRVLYETQGARPQFSNATLIDGTSTVVVPLKVMVAGKTKLFHGFGANKKQAKCAAAKQALKSFKRKT